MDIKQLRKKMEELEKKHAYVDCWLELKLLLNSMDTLPRVGDEVHVYSESRELDFMAVVLDVFDDGTSRVQSNYSNIIYLVATATIHPVGHCVLLHGDIAQ